jgi:hypothetical protein
MNDNRSIQDVREDTPRACESLHGLTEHIFENDPITQVLQSIERRLDGFPRLVGGAARGRWRAMSGVDFLPANQRARMPSIAEYYAHRVRDLGKPSATGWALDTYPFHADTNRGLSVHLGGEHGHWRCSGARGSGDVANFHMRLCRLTFKAAVTDLIGLMVTT